MSIDQARSFLDKLEADQDLARRVDDALVEAILGIAQDDGQQFSESDLRAAMDGPAGSPDDGLPELEDHELDQVVAAGGLQYQSSIGTESIGVADTVFAGAGDLLNLRRFSSFSKTGFTR